MRSDPTKGCLMPGGVLQLKLIASGKGKELHERFLNSVARWCEQWGGRQTS